MISTRMNLRNHISLLLLVFPFSIFCQDTIDDDVQQKIENVAENINNEDADYSNLVEQLSYYHEHPINLNSATKEELMDFGVLSEIQINNLLTHISKNGKLLTIYELQSIEGFDMETIKKILPYIFVSDNISSAHFSLKEMFKNGQNVFTLRYTRILEEQTGFAPADSGASQSSRYLGTPEKIYSRYRFTYGNNVSWGVTGEKDAGEEFFTGTQKNGFDFYSAHFFVRNVKFVKAFAVGDYTVGFGQGLTTWSGIAYGKSADAVNIKKNSSGIRPYSSVDENRFFRGVATTLGYKSFSATGFYSKKKIDANVADTLADGEILAVSSLQETGYHTTPSELADKHSLEQTVYGGNFSFSKRKIRMAINYVSSMFSADYNRSLELYSQYSFSEKHLSNFSFDYNFILKNFNFFGEVAISDNAGMAFLNGVLVALDPKLSFSLVQRYYQKNYQSIFANSFAENTLPANEQGIYFGITAKPAQYLSINAYFDHYVFPWLKYQVDAPSSGSDWLAQINYTPSKKLDIYFRVKQKSKFSNFNVPDEIYYIVPTKQTNYRFNISYTLSPSFKLKNRVEYLTWDDGTGILQDGFLIYQDLTFKKLSNPLSLTLRYALFQTDSYDSRLYAYENDIPGSYSIPAYYYNGMRTYVMVNYDITRRIEVWVRWAQTYYSNKNVISEGSLTEINGNTKTEIKAQVRIKF